MTDYYDKTSTFVTMSISNVYLNYGLISAKGHNYDKNSELGYTKSVVTTFVYLHVI